MRWDDGFFTGERDEYSWLVTQEQIPGLSSLITNAHDGLRAYISTIDSGVPSLGEQDRQDGWKLEGDVLVSPPLGHGGYVYLAEYGEAYIGKDLPMGTRPVERFVNYGGFNLADTIALTKSLDPTWDRRHFDFLIPIQERFWAQIFELRPETYVGSGDNDVLVSKSRELVERAIHNLNRHSPKPWNS